LFFPVVGKTKSVLSLEPFARGDVCVKRFDWMSEMVVAMIIFESEMSTGPDPEVGGCIFDTPIVSDPTLPRPFSSASLE